MVNTKPVRLRYVQSFYERFTESRLGSESEWEPDNRPHPIDKQLNDWVDNEGALIVDIKEECSTEYLNENHRMHYVKYLVVYTASSATVEDDHKPTQAITAPPVPIKAGAKAPTVVVIQKDSKGSRQASAMAGLFGVPEGYRFGADDTEPAPVPIFSPDFDIRKYADLFGNVEAR